MIENICKTFTSIYSCYIGNQSFELKNSDYNKNLLSNFIKKISVDYHLELIDDSWIENYILFQLQYYSNKKTKLDGKIYLNWIFGDKAIDRWNKRKSNWEYWIHKFSIDIGFYKEIDFFKPSQDEITEYEHRERMRFYGYELGLVHCHANELFSIDNEDCKKCKFLKICDVQKRRTL